MADNPKGKSPYAKYGKAPYQYSPELQAWTNAVKRGDGPDIERQDMAWKRKFAPHCLDQEQ